MPRIDIPFEINQQTITQPTNYKIAAGGQNYFYATFNLCNSWNDIPGEKAIFTRGNNSIIVDLVNGESHLECRIPWEMMQKPGYFHVGVFGGDRLPTNAVRVDVIEGCIRDGVEPLPPTPDWFSNIEKKLNDKVDTGNIPTKISDLEDDTAKDSRIRYTESTLKDDKGNIINDCYSNAIKTAKRGNVLIINDVSPIEHKVKVNITGDDIDLSKIIVTKYRRNFLPNNVSNTTYRGITVTVNDDGSIVCNGKSTGNVALYLTRELKLPIGKYKLSGPSKMNWSCSIRANYFINNEQKTGVVNYGDDGTITGYSCILNITDEVEYINCYIYIPTGTEVSNLTFYPMIKLEDDLDNSYEPYIAETYIPNKDGTIYFTSVDPIMSFTINNPKAIMDIKYNRDINKSLDNKKNRTKIIVDYSSEYKYEFSLLDNSDVRLMSAKSIVFKFSESYKDNYCAGLAFTCGNTPVQILYDNDGVVEWTGMDCISENGMSSFIPQANKHYDIIFLYNGFHLIGSVSGYIPSTVYNNGKAMN